MPLGFNPSTLPKQLAATKTFTLLSFFIVLLAIKITFRSEYIYPENYITRSSPIFIPGTAPNPSGGLLSSILVAVTSLLDLLTGGSLRAVPDNACQRSIDQSESSKSALEFDFIVVGSGAAGAVVANRLSKNGNVSVLVIEAGGEPPIEHIPPQFFPFVLYYKGAVWPYHAEINENASMAFKYGCPMQFGKQLGGTTSINAMLWVCGNNRDYNYWNASGAVGWDYESVLPYFRKIENNADTSKSLHYHGKDGPLTISTYEDLDPFIDVIKKGWNQLGYKTINDYSAETYNGIVTLQTTTKKGERQNSYQGYLQPVKSRKNLFFAYNALATKVTFDKIGTDDTTATGVIVQTGIDSCSNIHFKARKEVILSAGGFGSPKILLQSGVGPKEHLEKLKIPIVKDLPVGKNFQDHATGVNWMKINPNADGQTEINLLMDGFQYLMLQKGNFAQMGTMHADGFINITDVDATYPDVQNIMYRFEKQQQYLKDVLANFGYTDEIIDQLYEINQDHQLLMTFVTVVTPKSTGVVELRGTDPSLPLNITSGYFTDPENYDRDTMAAGMVRLGDLIETEAWNETQAEFINFDLPLCVSYEFASLEYWKCYTKYFTASEWHFTGTSKMGAANDPTAVVDPRLRVRGIKNLRVVDAGIMPKVPSGNTQCPTYMVGEKGSAMIIEDHKL